MYENKYDLDAEFEWVLSDEFKKHLVWMVNNMPCSNNELDAWNRWLGFVQGVLVVDSKVTIDFLRSINRHYIHHGYLKTKKLIEEYYG